MSSEPDYNFNQPVAAQSDSFSLQLPFALLSTAIAILMVAQTVGVIRTGNALHDNKTKYADALRNREALVKQSGEIQNKLQALILDLLLLSKTAEDAKAIVSKYNIQQNGNAAAPGGAAAPAEGAK